MKTTLNLPEELYREVKVKAVREGVPVTELVVKGLQMLLSAEAPARRRIEFPLIPAQVGVQPITTERVKAILGELDAEEDRYIGVSGRH